MSDFKAKMYQIQFRLGLRPRPRWGAYSAPQTTTPAGLRGLLLRGGEGTGREGRGEGRKGTGRRGEGRGRDPTPLRSPNPYFWIRPWCYAAFPKIIQQGFVLQPQKGLTWRALSGEGVDLPSVQYVVRRMV